MDVRLAVEHFLVDLHRVDSAEAVRSDLA